MRTGIEAGIKKDMYQYLLLHLSDESKNKLSEHMQAIEEILEHLARWTYNNKASLLVKMANKCAGQELRSTTSHTEKASQDGAVDFCDELEKL